MATERLLVRTGKVVVLAALILASGCAGRDGKTILTSANGYAFHFARYGERCTGGAAPATVLTLTYDDLLPMPREDCLTPYALLTRWKLALDEASEAYKAGGKLPDQLKALREAEAKTRNLPW